MSKGEIEKVVNRLAERGTINGWGGPRVLDTQAGDNNLMAGLIQMSPNEFVVVAHILEEGHWYQHEYRAFSDEGSARSRFEQVVKGL